MTRWRPDAAARLHDAALDLFVEQGFTATTVPQIAARAGLTTRTFFRHYADKREVLFVGEDELPAMVARVVDEAAASLSPIAVIRWGLETIVIPRIEPFSDDLLRGRAIVRSDEGLSERGLRKLAILREAATTAFIRRGLDPADADMAARLAIAVYDATLELWLDGGATTSLTDSLSDVLAALTRVTQG